jgi:hypothetical protein
MFIFKILLQYNQNLKNNTTIQNVQSKSRFLVIITGTKWRFIDLYLYIKSQKIKKLMLYKFNCIFFERIFEWFEIKWINIIDKK